MNTILNAKILDLNNEIKTQKLSTRKMTVIIITSFKKTKQSYMRIHYVYTEKK